MLLASSVCGLFKWRQFEPEVILLAVGWYLRFSLSYRDVEELLAERGLHADHVTVWRWVQRYAPEVNRRMRSRLNSTNDSWRVDSDLHTSQGEVALPVSCGGLFRRDDRLLAFGQAGRGCSRALPE
jgi:transposase-like protein